MAKTGFDQLMHIICVEWGFCGCIKHEQPLHVDMLIPPEGPVTADQFVDWVFLADDMNPNSDAAKWQRHKTAIRHAFIEYMGAEIVDASTLRWSCAQDEPSRSKEKVRGRLS